ncbi:MAG TPA: hypothetical protein PLZ76_01120, partial [Bacillota bacterium]|nr:hypothetical protein [Bacillota bacterium]
MYIRLTKYPSKEEYKVYLVESYRDKAGVSRQRILKSYGNLSELMKDNPNALEELKAWAKATTAQAPSKALLEIDLAKVQDGSKPILNIGYIILKALHHELKIPEFIHEYQSKTHIEYPLNAILELLTYSRCLNPSSKKKTFEGK